ncbi:MAG: cysteine synthase family protein [Candidatus Sericytochromatia bacterium]|nr:cysteine synthase family protein [Candidatus Sericytochromatia bacterium]
MLESSTQFRPGASARPRLARDVTEALGQVPLLRLNRLGQACEAHELFLKLEACNPGGSIKEKNAAFLIKEAEESGLLPPGGTIVESSSGNFGIGLAMVGAARGYRVIIVVDAKTAPPMRRMLKAYGAELVDVPLSEADANGSMQVARMSKARALAQELPDAWYPCQHLNPLNPEAHALHTAREIEAAFDGAPDVIVVGLSTAGQLAGIARYFRRWYAGVRLVGVDVAGSAILGTPRHPYKMTGLGLSFAPPNYDPRVLDAAYSVPDDLAFSVCHALARREGLLLGASTGAIVAAGLAFASLLEGRQKVVMLNPDRGDRYLETVYDPSWLRESGIEILEEASLEAAIAALDPVPRLQMLAAGPASL